MAKELRVERRDHDAGSARGLPMLPEGLDDQRCEMVRMGLGSLPGGIRVVRHFLPQSESAVCDAPVSQSVHPVFAVEFQVGAVPGVSIVGAPHLDARPRVPREDHDFAPTGRRDRVRLVRRKARSVAGRIETALAQAVFVRADGSASGNEVRIYEEVPEPVPSYDVFEAGTEPGLRRSDGTGPFVSRAIGALRKPDTAGRSTEVPAVARNARGDLSVDRFIAAQEGPVSVGGSRP